MLRGEAASLPSSGTRGRASGSKPASGSRGGAAKQQLGWYPDDGDAETGLPRLETLCVEALVDELVAGGGRGHSRPRAVEMPAALTRALDAFAVEEAWSAVVRKRPTAVPLRALRPFYRSDVVVELSVSGVVKPEQLLAELSVEHLPNLESLALSAFTALPDEVLLAHPLAPLFKQLKRLRLVRCAGATFPGVARAARGGALEFLEMSDCDDVLVRDVPAAYPHLRATLQELKMVSCGFSSELADAQGVVRSHPSTAAAAATDDDDLKGDTTTASGKLHKLDIIGCACFAPFTLETAAVEELLFANPALTEVNFYALAAVARSTLDVLAFLSHLKQVELASTPRVALSGGDEDEEQVWRAMRSVERLSLSHFSMGGIPPSSLATLAADGSLPSLTELDLAGCHLTAKHALGLARLLARPGLRLSLAENAGINDEALDKVVEHHARVVGGDAAAFPFQLAALDLSQTSVRAPLLLFRLAEWAPRLRELDVSSTPVSWFTLMALLRSPGLSKLDSRDSTVLNDESLWQLMTRVMEDPPLPRDQGAETLEWDVRGPRFSRGGEGGGQAVHVFEWGGGTSATAVVKVRMRSDGGQQPSLVADQARDDEDDDEESEDEDDLDAVAAARFAASVTSWSGDLPSSLSAAERAMTRGLTSSARAPDIDADAPHADAPRLAGLLTSADVDAYASAGCDCGACARAFPGLVVAAKSFRYAAADMRSLRPSPTLMGAQ